MARLIYMFKDKILDAFPLNQDRGLSIGRHRSNDLIIDNLAVSGYHARVDFNEERFIISDLQSKNGTYVNGEPVTESPLNHKDIIIIGKHSLQVDLLDEIPIDQAIGADVARTGASSALSDENTMFLDTPNGRQMRGEEAPPAPPSEPIHPENDNLSFISGGQGEIPLSNKTISIGKNSDADIVVGGLWALLVGSPAATIKKQAGDYVMHYNGGLVKPKRNGDSVKGSVRLHHEDIIEVGPVKVRIQLCRG